MSNGQHLCPFPHFTPWFKFDREQNLESSIASKMDLIFFGLFHFMYFFSQLYNSLFYIHFNSAYSFGFYIRPCSFVKLSPLFLTLCTFQNINIQNLFISQQNHPKASRYFTFPLFFQHNICCLQLVNAFADLARVHSIL